jgi:hypothetical protein
MVHRAPCLLLPTYVECKRPRCHSITLKDVALILTFLFMNSFRSSTLSATTTTSKSLTPPPIDCYGRGAVSERAHLCIRCRVLFSFGLSATTASLEGDLNYTTWLMDLQQGTRFQHREATQVVALGTAKLAAMVSARAVSGSQEKTAATE